MSGDHNIELSTQTKGFVRLSRRLLANNIGLLLRFYDICGKVGNLSLIGWPIRSFGRWYCRSIHGTEVICREEAHRIIERAKEILAFPCACRQTFKNCKSPILNCLIISDSDLFFHAGAPRARYISKQAAIEIIEEAERQGMFHSIAWCQAKVYALCNCCRCCCIAYRGLIRYNIDTALSCSSLVAIVDEVMCDRCKRCIQVCPFKAIGEEDDRIFVDPDKCCGCGICRQSCSQGAMDLVKRVELEGLKRCSARGG